MTKEEKVPINEEQFAPDPETVPYLTKDVLDAKKKAEFFVDTEVVVGKQEDSVKLKDEG